MTKTKASIEEEVKMYGRYLPSVHPSGETKDAPNQEKASVSNNELFKGAYAVTVYVRGPWTGNLERAGPRMETSRSGPATLKATSFYKLQRLPGRLERGVLLERSAL